MEQKNETLWNQSYFIPRLGVVTWTDLPLPGYRGKVRDVHELSESLLIVATDRLSSNDVVMPNGVPGKGKTLNQMSAFWFRKTESIIGNHMISVDIDEILSVMRAEGVPSPEQYREILDGRTMLVRRTKPAKTESVERGYNYGSLEVEYNNMVAALTGGEKTVTINGVELPVGLVRAQKLDHPIYTPAAKSSTGHDVNISAEHAREIVGEEAGNLIEEASLALYQFGADYAAPRGIIIADTKFEFGEVDGKIILIDELLTSDSSRFWDATLYRPGQDQRSYDKQPVRDYLKREKPEWKQTFPGPVLPDSLIETTSAKYGEVLEMITGITL